jgi:hypothetical protein
MRNLESQPLPPSLTSKKLEIKNDNVWRSKEHFQETLYTLINRNRGLSEKSPPMTSLIKITSIFISLLIEI